MKYVFCVLSKFRIDPKRWHGCCFHLGLLVLHLQYIIAEILVDDKPAK